MKYGYILLIDICVQSFDDAICSVFISRVNLLLFVFVVYSVCC